MSGVQARRQVADIRALAAFRVPVGPAGMVLGRVSDGSQAVVRFFRPEPTRVAVVGGWWLGRLLVFRSLALGARVVVRTSTVDQWQGLSEWATGRPDRLAVISASAPIALPAASQTQPVLHVLDDGVTGNLVPTSPWHTRLSLIHQLTQPAPRQLGESDLRIMQRLTGPEAAVAQSHLRLSAQTAGLLQVLEADMLAVLGAGPDTCLWLTPTSNELQTLGPPRRHG